MTVLDYDTFCEVQGFTKLHDALQLGLIDDEVEYLNDAYEEYTSEATDYFTDIYRDQLIDI